MDFLITVDRKSSFAAEARSAEDRRTHAGLAYFCDRLRIPFAYQVSLVGNRAFLEDGVNHVPAHAFLGAPV